MTSWFKTDSKATQKQNERALRQTERELNRDQRQLDQIERQLELDIKKHAKAGDEKTVRILAKQLVDLRKQKTRSKAMKATVSGVGTQAKLMGSQAKMAQTMGATAKTMGAINKQMDPMALAKNMNEFKEANMKMEMTDEMINDALDDIMTESGDEDEEAEIVNKVLDEIGIEIKGQLAKAPAAPSESAVKSGKMTDAEMEAMLEKLKAD